MDETQDLGADPTDLLSQAITKEEILLAVILIVTIQGITTADTVKVMETDVHLEGPSIIIETIVVGPLHQILEKMKE